MSCYLSPSLWWNSTLFLQPRSHGERPDGRNVGRTGWFGTSCSGRLDEAAGLCSPSTAAGHICAQRPGKKQGVKL